MKAHVAAGHRWVVDLDLEAFFDRVNHDLLMARVARRVHDKRVLRLIRRYLEAGMFQLGLTAPRRQGAPQGGPLSTLLANVLLDDHRAWKSAGNGRGPWWNAGASHMNQALPRKWFDGLGLVSVLDTVRGLTRSS